MKSINLLWAALAVFLTGTGAVCTADAYDPLAVSADAKLQTLDLTVRDAPRQRDIPVRVYLPQERKPAPVVLFSHGLGGSREGNAYMGQHWSDRGYVVVFTQHAGSDAAVWRDQPLAERMPALRRAASAQNFLLRVQDIHAVLDQLEHWNADSASPLSGRLDLQRVGMSGHSFGATTTQAVSGQHYPFADSAMVDGRIKAALMCSPQKPSRGELSEAFGSVKIPWMLMTGTKDKSPISEVDPASRLAVFEALPPGDKYELVLDGAEHSAFSDRALPGDQEKRNPNHHRAILALSTAFWDAYLREDPAAKAWLNGSGPRGVLQEKDRWETK